jgi:RNA polymerase sigma-70 factor (ECF subfamily)
MTGDVERSDADWMQLLAEPGSPAYRELRARLVTGLRPVMARRQVGDDLLEDFAQEAVLRIRDHLATFRGESRFLSWALSIAIRVAFTELRRARWRDVSWDALTADAGAPLEPGPGAPLEPGAGAPPQDRALARRRVLAALHAVIDGALTEKQQRVLVAELRGMPHSVIADHLGMNRNALYKLSHDARRKVKTALAQAGIGETDVLWAFE